MRKAGTLIAGTAVIAAALGATATPVAAAPAANQTYQSTATHRCIDDTSAGFRTWECNGTLPQQWIVYTYSPGVVRLMSAYTSGCIDDSDDQGFRTFPCNNTDHQKWEITRRGDGAIQMRNRATHRCIDDSNAGFRTWTCNPDYQQWWV